MTFLDVLAGELRKTLTLRPLLVAVAVSAALLLAYCALDGPGVRSAFEPTSADYLPEARPEEAGVYAFGLLTLFPIIAGVLVASHEHAGGQLTTSALSSPRRGRLVAAKLVIAAGISLVLGIFLAALVFLFHQAALGGLSAVATGRGEELATTLARAVACWVLIGVTSTCAALLLRSSVVVLAVLITTSLLGPALAGLSSVFAYLPLISAPDMIGLGPAFVVQTSPDFDAADAALTAVGWTAAGVVAAVMAFRRRDVGPRQASVE